MALKPGPPTDPSEVNSTVIAGPVEVIVVDGRSAREPLIEPICREVVSEPSYTFTKSKFDSVSNSVKVMVAMVPGCGQLIIQEHVWSSCVPPSGWKLMDAIGSDIIEPPVHGSVGPPEPDALFEAVRVKVPVELP